LAFAVKQTAFTSKRLAVKMRQTVRTMKIVLTLIFTFVLASSAIAQTEKTQSVATNKVAIISSEAFYDEKTGIKDMLEAIRKLDGEFSTQKQEFELMENQAEKLEKEIGDMSE
jgi:hypothetical protein